MLINIFWNIRKEQYIIQTTIVFLCYINQCLKIFNNENAHHLNDFCSCWHTMLTYNSLSISNTIVFAISFLWKKNGQPNPLNEFFIQLSFYSGINIWFINFLRYRLRSMGYCVGSYTFMSQLQWCIHLKSLRKWHKELVLY